MLELDDSVLLKEYVEGRVLKLFHGWVPLYRAQREYNVTRAVHAAGLPAPAAYEFVTINDRSGIVFERIEGLSMLRHVQARPWTLFSAVKRLAELHAPERGRNVLASARSAELKDLTASSAQSR